MKVETRLIQQTITGGESTDTDKREPWTLRAELRGWKRLFGQKYRDRTMVGVFIMVFQRTFVSPNFTSFRSLRDNIRMERH